MRQYIARTRNQLEGIGLICILAVGFLLISLARLMSDLGSTAFDVQIVKTALTDPLWQTHMGLNIALFMLALLAVHLAFGLACWLMAVLTERVFPDVRCTRRQWVLVWFLLGVCWVLVANATYFLRSSLGEPYQAAVTARVLGTTLHTLLATCVLVAIAAVFIAALRRRTTWLKYAGPLTAIAALAAIAGIVAQGHAHSVPVTKQPNVIFLGIDSLRPDAVDPYTAPNIDKFLGSAVRMTDTITPLARTFPSWVSVLTGKHPHTTGAIMNLLPREMIHTGATLPEMLREHGYRTSYAIDETRFSNLDETYGFDQRISPAIGGSDFVLTRFADTPLSNLIMNTWIGALLFPHIHANRAAHVTYDPDSFVHRINRELDFTQPMFLAAHLTLPHWPYTWATSSMPSFSEENAGDIYRETVRRVDRQFGDLLKALERRGILDNAVVVVLSDHGEALGQPDDFMPDSFPDKDEKRIRFQKWGHGTSVFSPHQYRVVLGIRAYGNAANLIPHAGVVHDPVSLVDLAPTILDLLGLPSRMDFDGQSLVPLIRLTGDTTGFAERIRFTESEYNPQGFSLDQFTASALAAAAKVYRLDSHTDRITVRVDKIDSIMSSRQYAALMGNGAIGAAIPGNDSDGSYEFIYVPSDRSDRNDAGDSAQLREALHKRFGIEISP